MPDLAVSIKKLMLYGISEIPAVGGLIAAIVDLLWDDGPNGEGWETIRKRTEALIKDALDADAKERLAATLAGLRRNLDGYVVVTRTPDLDRSHTYAVYAAVRSHFNQQIPQFMIKSRAVLLLPLFVQAANLHLVLLRDAIHHGESSMAMKPVEVAEVKRALHSSIVDYTAWARQTYATAVGAPAGGQLSDLRNAKVTQLTVDVLDYVELWQAWDPEAQVPANPLGREVFSRVYGAPAGLPQSPVQRGYYPPPKPGLAVTRLRGGQVGALSVGLDGLSARYTDGSTSGWMGNQQGMKRLVFDHVLTGRVVVGLIIAEYGRTLVRGIGLRYADGTRTPNPLAGEVELPVPDGHHLTSVNAASSYADASRGQLYHDVVRSVWLGFRFTPQALEPLPPPPPRLLSAARREAADEVMASLAEIRA